VDKIYGEWRWLVAGSDEVFCLAESCPGDLVPWRYELVGGLMPSSLGQRGRAPLSGSKVFPLVS
jgi:hypothetical protein